MSDLNQLPHTYSLGNHGGQITFESPESFLRLVEEELKAWNWLDSSGTQQASNLLSRHRTARNRLVEVQQLYGNQQGEESWQRFTRQVDAQLAQLYVSSRFVFHSSSNEAAFLKQLRTERGETVAAGAYAMLLAEPFGETGGNPKFIEGLIEGFMFKQSLNWVAQTHAELMETNKKRYLENFAQQSENLKQLELLQHALNHNLNVEFHKRSDAFDELEKGKRTELDLLHKQQGDTFDNLLKIHSEKLNAIENAYNQKLALQKPVEYWQEKGKRHRRNVKWVGFFGALTMVGMGGGIGWSIYRVLGRLEANENPRAWQLGILALAVFIFIWITRLFVRIFLSNLHLASDADERCTMVLTYLSMAREGSEFNPDEKKLILQNLFRTASDGLVKDDGAPNVPLSMFSK